MKKYWILLLVLLWTSGGTVAQDLAAGKKQFAALCSGCHGSDGGGGEHGPNIVDLSRRGTGRGAGENLTDVIKNGTEGGMPAFPLPENQMAPLVAYIRDLRAPAAELPAQGNAENGARFFAGKGNCTSCHMVNGSGGTLGPDLSNIGLDRRVLQIEQALRNPGSSAMPGYQAVTVKLRDGSTVRGVARNESTFDLQVQTFDGKLRSFAKSQIAGLTREAKSLMPAVTAPDDDMRDLLAYLSRLTRDSKGAAEIATAPSAGGDLSIEQFEQVVHPKAGDWPTYHGNIGGNRHSPLLQINTSNVARLAAKWMFPIAGGQRLEVTPIVVDGVMYATMANEAYAVDAKNGREIWHYSRPLTPDVVGDAASKINRGVAVLGDKVFMLTDNAHMIALSRTGGQLLWDTEMADYKQHYGGTSAPLVVKDLVLGGTSGGDEGARGFLDAFNVNTGNRAWRFWMMPAKGEPLSETWVGRAIEHGCVTAWLTGTYDPETDLIYWPTGNPCPDYNGDERKGDNLYASSVVALEPATGKLRWYFQFSPHDLHDWDATETPMLVDADWHGKPRKLLLQANRNGFFYVLDRVTGEFLLGQPFAKKITWASGIDAKGRPILVPGQEPSVEGTKTCPATSGATNWMSTAYSSATGLYYVMVRESCAIYTKSDAWWEPGKSFYGGGARLAPGEPTEKFLRAIDIQTGKIAWEIPQIGTGGSWGGLISTAGGLVFYCDDSGAFAAIDARNGKPLWNFHTNQSWHASPMTYMVDGKQYMAVAAGSNIIAFALP